MSPEKRGDASRWGIGRLFRTASNPTSGSHSSDDEKAAERTSGLRPKPTTWSMGVLNDPETVEVPGSVLLLASDRNEPLGLRNVHARTSHSSIPAGFLVDVPLTPGGTRISRSSSIAAGLAAHVPEEEPLTKKMTADGTVILDPQPDDSANDPLNWPSWRRDAALLSIGFYCMIGGGMTPVIAAGFTNVAHDFDVSVEKVALTTGLYMMGLGVGSVVASPTAILYGKRPVYLASAIILIGTSLWAAWSPSFNSLLIARVFQGVAISPVECLPSATVAEIFFLHERAFRIGIYTLLLLGGKNLIPLVSAAIIGRFGWRWTFWIVAMVVAFGSILLFLFVPETFWDRTPTRKPSKRPSLLRRLSSRHGFHLHKPPVVALPENTGAQEERPHSPGAAERHKDLHVGFAPAAPAQDSQHTEAESATAQKHSDHDIATPQYDTTHEAQPNQHVAFTESSGTGPKSQPSEEPGIASRPGSVVGEKIKPTLDLANNRHSRSGRPSLSSPTSGIVPVHESGLAHPHGALGMETAPDYFSPSPAYDTESLSSSRMAVSNVRPYTHNLRRQPPQSFVQQLKPWHGRLNKDKWLKVMVRPFILFAYPAVLWSSVVYACSIGWLIVISELMAIIYRNPKGYNFSALQTGLVYISPFLGGILGTGVAGKVSDIIVKSMARRNGGMYEPEFRLVMALPILLCTCIGLMGFGWSAQERDNWIIPTVFFGITSFGCSLGSTTSITFCVDSYRQYAGEALVTLNFSKNILHGLVFSLFVSHWLAEDGPKKVFMWLGIIQLILLLSTVPMYIYGKRARMWTVRKNLMEKF